MFVTKSIKNRVRKNDPRPILIVSKSKNTGSASQLRRENIERQPILPTFLHTLKKYRLIILDLVTANYEVERIRAIAAQCSVIVNLGVADSSLARSCFNAGAVDCVPSLADGLKSAKRMYAQGLA